MGPASLLNMWSVDASLCPVVKMQMDVCDNINTPRVLILSWAHQPVPNVFLNLATSFLSSCSGTRNIFFVCFVCSHSGLSYILTKLGNSNQGTPKKVECCYLFPILGYRSLDGQDFGKCLFSLTQPGT